MPIENALNIITIVNGNGTIHHESPSVEQMLGYEPGELIGKNLFEFIHPDDVLSVIDVFSDGLQIPGCIASLEFRFQHKDSSWRNLNVVAKNLVNNPTVAGIVLSSRDVTERVRAERARRTRTSSN
jgi:PAS domain S-box-containing protein